MFRLNTGFFLVHQAWATMSIALGPFSWQTLGDNFVCLTILIDLEEVSLIYPHDVNESLSFAQSFLLDFVFYAFSHCMYLRLIFFSVTTGSDRSSPLSLQPWKPSDRQLKLQNFSLLSNLPWNLRYFSSSGFFQSLICLSFITLELQKNFNYRCVFYPWIIPSEIGVKLNNNYMHMYTHTHTHIKSGLGK